MVRDREPPPPLPPPLRFPIQLTDDMKDNRRIWSLTSQRTGHFCSDQGDHIDCSITDNQEWEQFTAYPLGGEEYAIKSGRTGRWCSDDDGDNGVVCDRTHINPWEVFRKYENSDGTVSFRGRRWGRYCASENDRMICNRPSIGEFEKFTLLDKPHPDNNLVGATTDYTGNP